MHCGYFGVTLFMLPREVRNINYKIFYYHFEKYSSTLINVSSLQDGSQFDSSCQNISLEEHSSCPCHSHYSYPLSKWSQCIVGGHFQEGRINFIFGSSYASPSRRSKDSTEYFESSGSGIVRSDGTYSIDGVFDSYYLKGDNPRSDGDRRTWDREKQMEQEIREELNNEISLMDLSFEEVKEGGEMQEKGVCGVGARYRAVTCVRNDDVIVHPR